MKGEISVHNIVFWIIVFSMVLFAWRVLGQSESRGDTKYLKQATIEQIQILKDIREAVRK